MDLIKVAEAAFMPAERKEYPDFQSGDTITVSYKIKEGNKERIQQYRGVVLQVKGHGEGKTFTVRKISNGVGVERIFPMNSPFIDQIEVNKRGKVRRSRIYYLRKFTGKRANIREKILFKAAEEKQEAVQAVQSTDTQKPVQEEQTPQAE